MGNLILVIAIALLVAWFSYSNQKTRNRKEKMHQQYEVVRATSTCYQDLLRINQQYSFYSDFPRNRTLQAEVESKRKFDIFDFDGMLEHHLRSNKNKFAAIIDHIEYNQKVYASYLDRVNQLNSSINDEQAMAYHIPRSTYQMLEKQLIEEEKLQPKTNMQIVCKVSYTSPKGKNSYTKERQYTLFQIKERYRIMETQLRKESAREYQQKYERARMSASLRYTVLRRDHFRCQICGATQADGVKLHVDHIVPISRGGKTELANLRTLCERCNLGKGNKKE